MISETGVLSGRQAVALVYCPGCTVAGASYPINKQIKKMAQSEPDFRCYEFGAGVLAEMQKPYFKEEYLGKPTRRFTRLICKAERVERG